MSNSPPSVLSRFLQRNSYANISQKGGRSDCLTSPTIESDDSMAAVFSAFNNGMGYPLLPVFLAAALSLQMQVSGGASTYRAAVVEYHPSTKIGETAKVAENVLNYEKLMRVAKMKGAEIIVFPEGGLGTKETRSYIPDPAEKVIPCDTMNLTISKVLSDLSCASKKNTIYSVINLVEKRDCEDGDDFCPPKGFYVFNTNVVFDRQGMVIARYAKYNLFDEALTDHTRDPEISFFDTDFGVRFGTFTCFDILFSAPAQRLVQQYRITDFVFTTYWFSELPFLTALQAQRGWAESNNVNLLASGVNDPATGSGGSGIYNGKFGHIVQVLPQRITTKLLVADVPKIQENTYSDPPLKADSIPSKIVQEATRSYRATDNSSAVADDEQGFNLKEAQMYLYSSEVIEAGKKFDKTVCSSKNFCCQFEVDMDNPWPVMNFTVRAMAFNGVRRFGNTFRGGVQSCAVVLCKGPEIKHCAAQIGNIQGKFKFKQIKITGNFNLRNSFQMPSTLASDNQLLPLSANKYVFKRSEKDTAAEVSLELVWPVDNLQTFAIWGRDFTRDMEPIVPESGASTVLSLPSLLLSLIVFLLLR